MTRHAKSLHRQRGAGILGTLICLVIFGFFAYLMLYQHSRASVKDVQEVVASASKNGEAKSFVSQAMKETPNPTNDDLTGWRIKVNDILVTATSREVTGDPSLTAPAAQEKQPKADNPFDGQNPWVLGAFALLTSVVLTLVVREKRRNP